MVHTGAVPSIPVEHASVDPSVPAGDANRSSGGTVAPGRQSRISGGCGRLAWTKKLLPPLQSAVRDDAGAVSGGLDGPVCGKRNDESDVCEPHGTGRIRSPSIETTRAPSTALTAVSKRRVFQLRHRVTRRARLAAVKRLDTTRGCLRMHELRTEHPKPQARTDWDLNRSHPSSSCCRRRRASTDPVWASIDRDRRHRDPSNTTIHHHRASIVLQRSPSRAASR